MSNDIQHLINLRKSLHQNPELSGNEEFTAEALKRTIIRYQPDDIIDNIGGYGVAFVFKSRKEGPTVLFRADMDALPIHESNDFDYASRTEGVSHQCGHDGHMTILVGLAEQISKNRPKIGKVVLLFQPAEETGEGAISIMNDPNFYRIQPDYCFALHNIPGFKKSQILVRSGTFSAASQGLIVKLYGKTSHAAEPDKGKSPAIAMSHIIESISKLPHQAHLFDSYILSTVVHANLGERTFGTSPGFGEVLITLRAFEDNDMNVLLEQTKQIIASICNEEDLTYTIGFTDVFPSTKNDPSLTALVVEMAKDIGLATQKLNKPFAWSEDFSQFSQQFKSTIFGLGAGADNPKLHNANYDFPDEILQDGINLFYRIYRNYLLD